MKTPNCPRCSEKLIESYWLDYTSSEIPAYMCENCHFQCDADDFDYEYTPDYDSLMRDDRFDFITA